MGKSKNAINIRSLHNFSGAVLALWISIVFAPSSAAQQAGSVETSQKMVEQWLSIEHQTSVLASTWLSQKPMLEQRLLLLEAEQQQLQALLNKKSDDSGEVEQQRTSLIEEQSELEQAQRELSESLGVLEQQLNALQPLLAPPIVATWQQESGSIASDEEASSRLQQALAKLNKLAEFNQRISVVQAPILSESGDSILVKQLFLGATAAWFVSLDGSFVGTGKVTASGWQWSFDDSLNSADVSRAIAMFEKKLEADFVNLPLQLAAQGEL